MKPAADDHRLAHSALDRFDDAIHVLQVAQREHAGQVDAFDRGPGRRSTRRQDQSIVGLRVLASRSEIAYAN